MLIRILPRDERFPRERLDVVLPAPDGTRPTVEVALVSVVLPDGREARFHVSVHVDERGALHAEIESKRVWRGKPTRCALALSAKDYTDPETGTESAFRRALGTETEGAE